MFRSSEYSSQSQLIAIILCAIGYIGIAGMHRIYTGKIWTGLLWMVTGGLFFIGTTIDLIALITGTFDDKRGRRLF